MKRLLILMISVLLILSACSSEIPKSASGKGGQIETSVGPNDSQKIDLEGWRMEIPEGVFAEDEDLVFKVLSEEESAGYATNGMNLIGYPVSVEVSERSNVRLVQPVTMTLNIPEDLRSTLNEEDLFLGYMYDGEWIYTIPDDIDFEKGIATFKLQHFSFFALVEPSEAEQIETYAHMMAVKQYESDKVKNEFLNATKGNYDELFKSFGVKSEGMRNKFAADMVTWLESATLESGGVSPMDALVQMANAASQGEEGKRAFTEKYLEFTGKAITSVLEKDVEKFSSGFNVVGNLYKVAESLNVGDEEGALTAVGDMLIGAAGPQAALVQSALNYAVAKTQDAIDAFTENEVEKAYLAYIGKGNQRYGFDAVEGDFETIFTLMGGGQRETEKMIIAHHVKKYGMKESDLTDEAKAILVKNAYNSLKNRFDQRKVDEVQIEQRQSKEESFIAELKARGLLSASNNQKFFGLDSVYDYDVTTRLEQLYALKNKVLGMLDKKVAETISDKELATIIDQWITFNQAKDRKSFYKYLREMKYITDVFEASKTNAWILVATKNFDAQAEVDLTNSRGSYQVTSSISPGSYSSTTAYMGDTDTYYDPDYIHGENLAVVANWSTPPSTIQGGETVSLTVSISAVNNQSAFKFAASTEAYIDKADMEPGFTSGYYDSFADENGKTDYEVTFGKNYATEAGTVSAKMPAGQEPGDQIAIVIGFYMGYRQGTVYVYEWGTP